MTTERLRTLIKAIPIVLGASLITTIPVRASEQADGHAQTPMSDQIVAEGVRETSSLEKQSRIHSVDASNWVATGAIAPDVKLDLTSENPSSLENADVTDVLADASTIDGQTEFSNSATELSDDALDVVEVPTISAEPTDATTEPTSDEMDVEDEATAPAPRWRLTFEPYVYIPLHVDGEVSMGSFDNEFGEDSDLDDVDRSLDIDIDTTVSEVIDIARDNSFFGFMGRTEAWRNRFGLIFDASYISLRQSNTTSLDVPDGLSNLIPSEIEVDTHFSYGQFDLGVGHRFTDGNLTEAKTDFDLGPVVFDVMGGVRIYTINAGIDIDTSLNRLEREYDRDTTFVTPLLSSRLRWNMSRNLALSVRGDIAGFGVHGMNLAWAATTGVDWMFSGDTSLFFGYRVSSIDYSRDGDNEIDVDLLMHGPYVGMVFRL